MDGIKLLGTSGSRSKSSFSTSIQLTKSTCIDAGNIIHGLGEEAKNINSIFLSHSHLDHIVDCAFLIDNYFSQRTEPLKIYGLQETLRTVQENFFNWDIWPDFSKLNLVGTTTPAVEYIPIELEKTYELEDGVNITPIHAEHVVPTCGFIIKKANSSILFSSDTYKNPKLWERINQDESINAVIIDVSFPNSLQEVAQASKHLTPAMLQEELKQLQRAVNIYITHLKPNFYDAVVEDLLEAGVELKQVVQDGTVLNFNGNIV